MDNSKWYLRIAPDETYADPCSLKAGFQVSFARINQDSLAWQRRLDPRKGEMEAAIAKLAGAPYKARKVSFHLPDFIDIVLNAGDSRAALGATIGESLPNWGPVANEGRGRTVAMTNLYTDADSRAAILDKASAILCKGTLDPAGLDPALTVMGTVLHEAAHNLGPAHEYKVKGKTTSEIFGGPLASTFEELKAQTSSLYFADWLADKGVIDKRTAALGHLSDIVWAFGHISEGMYAGDGTAKPYSHLSAIQVGSFLDAGAMVWKAGEPAANGKDEGCFEIRKDKLPKAIAALEKAVVGPMARGDKAAALKLKEKHVDGSGALQATSAPSSRSAGCAGRSRASSTPSSADPSDCGSTPRCLPTRSTSRELSRDTMTTHRQHAEADNPSAPTARVSTKERRRRALLRELKQIHTLLGVGLLRRNDLSDAEMSELEEKFDRTLQMLTGVQRPTRALADLDLLMLQIAVDFWEAPGLPVVLPNVAAMQLRRMWDAFVDLYPEFANKLPVLMIA